MIEELIKKWRKEHAELQKEYQALTEEILKCQNRRNPVEMRLAMLSNAISALKHLEYGSSDKWNEQVRAL